MFDKVVKRILSMLLIVMVAIAAYDLFLVGYGWTKAYF